VAPQLRSGLAAASVPAPIIGPIEAQFGACLHARLVASDPTVTPAACRLPGHRALPAAAGKALAGAGATAVRHDFAAALERTLWFQVAVFVAAIFLMLALPPGVGRRGAVTGPAAEADYQNAAPAAVIG
jgi:hypothetical protein